MNYKTLFVGAFMMCVLALAWGFIGSDKQAMSSALSGAGVLTWIGIAVKEGE